MKGRGEEVPQPDAAEVAAGGASGDFRIDMDSMLRVLDPVEDAEAQRRKLRGGSCPLRRILGDVERCLQAKKACLLILIVALILIVQVAKFFVPASGFAHATLADVDQKYPAIMEFAHGGAVAGDPLVALVDEGLVERVTANLTALSSGRRGV